jgi:hypothetical protein
LPLRPIAALNLARDRERFFVSNEDIVVVQRGDLNISESPLVPNTSHSYLVSFECAVSHESLLNNLDDNVATDRPANRFDCGSGVLTDEELYLFNQGTYLRAYEKLGAHRLVCEGVAGTYFAVWAPAAEQVFVTGTFNNWDKERDRLRPRGNSGIWEGFIAGVDKGALYKYLSIPACWASG